MHWVRSERCRQERSLSKHLLMMATPSSTFIHVASSAGVVSQFLISVVVVPNVVVVVVVHSVVAVVPFAVAFRRKFSSSLSHNALHANPVRQRKEGRSGRGRGTAAAGHVTLAMALAA